MSKNHLSKLEFLTSEALRTEAHLNLNKNLIQLLGLIPAALLANYLDKYYYHRKNTPRNKGWFFLTHEYQKNQLNIGEHSIIKYKKLLIKEGILVSKKMGIPAKEWFNIDFKELSKALYNHVNSTKILDPAISGGQEELISGGLINNTRFNKTRSNKKDISPNPNKPTLLERNKKYLPLAKKLAKLIQKKKSITHTTDQLKSWANDLRQLEENNKISIPRMKAVLKWYKINMGGQYIPVIESGSSFRSKFTKLEDAINRQENPIKNNNQPAPRNGYTSQEEMDDLKAYEKENTETL